MARDCILYFEDCKDEPIQFLQLAHLDYMAWMEQMSQAMLGRPLPARTEEITAEAQAFVDKGRWIWQCPGCTGHYFVSKSIDHAFCIYCISGEWRKIVQPTAPSVEEIETELLKMPGNRSQSPLRDWQWGWDLAVLQDRTERALALQSQNPGKLIDRLSPAPVRAWAAGEILTAPNMVTYLNNPIRQLQGYSGVIEPQDSIKIGLDDKYLQLVPQPHIGNIPAGAAGNGVLFINAQSGLAYLSNQQWISTQSLGHLWAEWPVGSLISIQSDIGRGVASNQINKRATTHIPPPAQNDRVLLSRANNTPQWSTDSVNAFGGGGFLSKATFDANGTWTKPEDCNLIYVECWGGGGQGRGSYNGGGGAYTFGWFDGADIAATVAVTVGGQSGTSSFGSHLSALGGGSASSSAHGAGGSAFGLDSVPQYAGGGRIRRTTSSYDNANSVVVDDSVYGGGGGDEGNSMFGGAGGGGTSTYGGDSGTRPGGGGEGNQAGAGGRVRVWSFSG